MPRRAVLWALFYAGVALIAFSYSTTGGRYLAQLAYSLGAVIPVEAQTISGSVYSFLRGIPRLLLEPYAWVRSTDARPQYGLYPGMWVMYLVIYPLSFTGMARAIRLNHQLSIPALTCLFLAGMLFLIAYGGIAHRQRLWLEVILIVYAAAGFRSPGRARGFALWYTVLAVFAGSQLLRLRFRT
jgi:hypothetical protein